MDKTELLNRKRILSSYEDTDVFKKVSEKLMSYLKESGALSELWNGYQTREAIRHGGFRINPKVRESIVKHDIVLDMLSGNSNFATEESIKMGDEIIKNAPYEFTDKYYYPLQLKTSEVSNIDGLTKWEKIFVENYYGQVDIDGTTPSLNNKSAEQVRKDCVDVCNKFQLNKDGLFFIDSRSKEVSKEADAELNTKNFAVSTPDFLAEEKRKICDRLAYYYSQVLDDEYKSIVSCLNGGEYDSAFKALVLRETAMKVYKINNGSIWIGKRKLTETVSDHMELNKTILDFMYKNVDSYNNFAELYFAARKNFDNSVKLRNEEELMNVPTHGKGRWIMFKGCNIINFPAVYDSADELSNLLSGTIWKANNLVNTQLNDGYLYVFINNDNKPCLSVKLNSYDNTIGEISRVSANGKLEKTEFINEINKESEYYDVLISFLTNNNTITNGKEWCLSEGLIDLLIDVNDLNDVETLQDLMRKMSINQEFKKLKLIKDKIMEAFNCTEEEICFGDYLPKEDETVCPYKVILGNVNFDYSDITSLGNLQFVAGSFSVTCSRIDSLANLKYIGGDARLNTGYLKDLGNLECIIGEANFKHSGIKDFAKLKKVLGKVYFESVEKETAYYEHMSKVQENKPTGMHL